MRYRLQSLSHDTIEIDRRQRPQPVPAEPSIKL